MTDGEAEMELSNLVGFFEVLLRWDAEDRTKAAETGAGAATGPVPGDKTR